MASCALQHCKTMLSHLEAETSEMRHAGWEGVSPMWLVLHAAVIKGHTERDFLQTVWQAPQCRLAQADGV